MSAIFLSASVPVPGRGHYHETADPFLIQVAVRELVAAVIRDHHLVWGGHPAITPMIWTICEDLGVEYARSVTLYQSRFFADRFPEENKRFSNTVLVDAVPEDRDASLLKMREQMLSRDDLHAAVFVGGMEGVAAEHELYRRFHPEGRVLAVGAPGARRATWRTRSAMGRRVPRWTSATSSAPPFRHPARSAEACGRP